ncbi:hypothetical protein ACQ4PT_020367 [Festuca glaucescens]
MAHASGSCEGASTTMADLQRLRRTHHIPEGVECRLPASEIEPVLNPGEYVVFVAHFDRGFGLPVSKFFRAFLEFFGLQPHHLPANAYLSLSCYAAFCEGYAGLWPDVDFWSRLFFLKAQTTDGELRACGAASLYPCRDVPFPKIPTAESVKKWQTTFFYVKNADAAKDMINLPAFSPAPPTKANWGYSPKTNDPAAEVNRLLEFLKTCATRDRLTGADLICTFISQRVLPLQKRVHKIFYMSGWLDLTRTSKVQLSNEGVARQVNHVSQAHLPDNWQWGMQPYRREDPPRVNFPRMFKEDGDLAVKIWADDLPGSEDEGNRAASEDENPDAEAGAAGGGQGESALTHPFVDLTDDDELMVLEPLAVTTLATAPPAAGHAPPVRKRKVAAEQPEASGLAAKKHQRKKPKAVPEAVGSAIKFSKSGGAVSASGAMLPRAAPQRMRREPTPQPLRRETTPTPPIFPLPSVGAGTSSSAPSAPGAGSSSQGELARQAGHPTIEEILRRSRPEAPTAGGGDGDVPMGDAGSGQAERQLASADAKAKAKGPAEERPQQQQLSLHVSSVAKQLANVASSADSSLGSVGTMEKEWLDADANEVTSRDGRKGVASLELFFSDFRNLLNATTTESSTRLSRCEKAVTAVSDKWTALYNKVVASYHRAKTERSSLARQLEVAQAAAQVLQLQEELRLSREQCSASQETAKGLAAKVQEMEGELARLRRLEANHLTELNTEAALAAADKARGERRAAGEEGSPHSSMEDHLAAMHARITPITMLGYELRQTAEELYRLLWPTETLPGELANLVKWLDTAPDRLLDWKESAARAGADMALSFVLSWYEEVSLDRLKSRRAGVEDVLSSEDKLRWLARASAIADFVNQAEFVSNPNPPEEDLEEEGEEMEDAGETAAPDADPASAPGAPPAGPPPAGP